MISKPGTFGPMNLGRLTRRSSIGDPAGALVGRAGVMETFTFAQLGSWVIRVSGTICWCASNRREALLRIAAPAVGAIVVAGPTSHDGTSTPIRLPHRRGRRHRGRGGSPFDREVPISRWRRCAKAITPASCTLIRKVGAVLRASIVAMSRSQRCWVTTVS